ncbi:FMN-binding negative transcriptional regulator [Ktedonobacter robiniae]|uniref:Protease synthase and sporulation protein PAI 2 n=1 Tax=Ktedonobacter robiniae TaxID=2778365 RepID=A0ABQ3UXT8_9CHLR|nr:FMN-binding negative transcriptional regulator [Ktedonobacter robiniae]GHO57130.1 protease synthase and sporulation protein PAI 2 [Ktedonobacter robiniae]
MYVPKHFREEDLVELHAFMSGNPFALAISNQEGVPVASHIPVILQAEPGPYGQLLGHFALGNSQWKTFDGSQEVLIIFQGPHAYISPSWYSEPEISVPTWNYAVVHAYGVPRLVEDPDDLMTLLGDQVHVFEGTDRLAWFLQPENEAMRKKARGVVGFTMSITRLQGKYKLNQNRSLTDQEQVIDQLETQDDVSKGVAALMRKRIAQ